MIITRTPFRISFFGGGTDFPEWYNRSRGKVISTSINKYCYISTRVLPPYFKYNYRLRYFKDEHISNIEKISHPAIRETLKYLNYKKGLEVVHNADLPALSGLGASSSFTVGFLNSMMALNKRLISKKSLGIQAIKIEQELIKESVGSQDQIAAAFGGFNIINFNKNYIEINPVNKISNIKKLEKSVFLIFTGFQRSAQKIEKKKIKKIQKKEYYYNELLKIADQAEKVIYNSNKIVKDYATLLRESWYLKKKLDPSVTNAKINRIYDLGIKNGAYAGKILGAGGGGFMLFLIDGNKRNYFNKLFKKYVIAPISFDKLGTQIIYNQDNE